MVKHLSHLNTLLQLQQLESERAAVLMCVSQHYANITLFTPVSSFSTLPTRGLVVIPEIAPLVVLSLFNFKCIRLENDRCQRKRHLKALPTQVCQTHPNLYQLTRLWSPLQQLSEHPLPQRQSVLLV